ncbi:MAG: dienelactone hydrolase family protein [Acidimicrobiia bacterium]
MPDSTTDSVTPLTIVKPSGTPRGGVIVLQEAFGVNEHIVDVCNRIAAAGYIAVAPHLFHRSGDPKMGYDDLSIIWPHIEAMTMDGTFADVDAAIAALEAEGIGTAKQGVVGFCLGGTVAFFAGTRRNLGAAVTFYGGGITGRWFFPSQVDEAPSLQAPWLGLYGDKDLGIPIDEVEQLRAAAATASVRTEVVRYPEAEHGFNCDRRPSYNAEAAADGWARMLAWFDSTIASA